MRLSRRTPSERSRRVTCLLITDRDMSSASAAAEKLFISTTFANTTMSRGLCMAVD